MISPRNLSSDTLQKKLHLSSAHELQSREGREIKKSRIMARMEGGRAAGQIAKPLSLRDKN
jgi:hypothetical protein